MAIETDRHEIRLLQPGEGRRYAQPIQALLATVFREVYVDRLGRQMNILADQHNPDLVSGQASRIDTSDNLGGVGGIAYGVALRKASQDSQPVVDGVVKFSRLGPAAIELEELDIAEAERGQRLGALLVKDTLDSLAVTDEDTMRIEVLNQNSTARGFYERAMGAVLTTETVHYDGILPNTEDYHVVYEVPVGVALQNLAAYVAPPA